MRVEPVHGVAAATVGDALVIADLHLGLEVELREMGIEVPSRGRQKRDKILRLVDRDPPERVVIAGDATHNIPYTSGEEAGELADLLDELTELAEVTVVPGNHDGGIERLVPGEVELTGPGGVLLGDVGVLHGHSFPSGELEDAETLLVGHTHPKVVLREENGATISRRAWLRYGGEQEVVIMPPFDPWGGSDVTREQPLGPLEYRVSPEVTLLDGTSLGQLEDLR